MKKYTERDITNLIEKKYKEKFSDEFFELIAIEINDSQEHPLMKGKSLKEQIVILNPYMKDWVK